MTPAAVSLLLVYLKKAGWLFRCGYKCDCW
jgi:hypothetical protein